MIPPFSELIARHRSITLTGRSKEAVMKVTTKGQVTIPQGIREQLGILPGTEVAFEVEGNAAKVRLVKGARRRGRKIVERLRGRATVRMTTDEIMALTRGR
jgi:AbrB family looped-hinge helix DNA binding protein